MPRAERGFALLEVMLALAILGIAGTALLGLLGAAMRDEYTLRSREEELQRADRLLAATALLTRADLDRRLGRHTVGEFIVEVERPEPTLYRLAISEAVAPSVETLVTVVYHSTPAVR